MAICSPRRLAEWLCLLILCTGCASPKTISAEHRPEVCNDDVRVEFISTWNQSVEAMRQLELEGVAQLEWTDEDGSHREQGDMQAWIDGDLRVSLRLTKFGDVVVWMGQDQRVAWMFDLLSDPTCLTIVAPKRSTLAGGLPLDPSVLRLLLGFEPLPDDAEVMFLSTGKRVTGNIGAAQFSMDFDDDGRPLLIKVAYGDRQVEARHRWTAGSVMPEPVGVARRCSRVVDLHHGEASMLKIQISTILLLTNSQLEEQSVVFDALGRIRSHLGPAVVEDRR